MPIFLYVQYKTKTFASPGPYKSTCYARAIIEHFISPVKQRAKPLLVVEYLSYWRTNIYLTNTHINV